MDFLFFCEGDVKFLELRLISFLFRDKFYDNVIFIWIYNEYVVLICVIKIFLIIEFVFCDNSWSGIFLLEGNVIIEIDV